MAWRFALQPSSIPEGWKCVDTLPCVVLVGLTGVGKSTAVDEVMRRTKLLLLPDRRLLTDEVIIAEMQASEGKPVEKVNDREARFAYTARYRQIHPGGMAHVLRHLWVEPKEGAHGVLFDGLRGENEVTYAAAHLPNARFVMLAAPCLVRLQRLLGRGGAFDNITLAACLGDLWTEAQEVFTAQELEELRSMAATASSPQQVLSKVKIVIEERRNYDPVATATSLRTGVHDRLTDIDTTKHSPEQVATMIVDLVSQYCSPCAVVDQPHES